MDNDPDFVESGRENGLDVRLLDLNDEEGLKRVLEQEKPDVVFLMYVFYFVDNPERLIEIVSRYSEIVILGGKNHGHWVQRLRFLFGRAPVTGEPLYQAYVMAWAEEKGFFNRIQFAVREWPRDINISYPRIWTHKDYVSLFGDLGLNWEVLNYRGFRIGTHHRRMFLGKLRAFAFQYALKRQ